MEFGQQVIKACSEFPRKARQGIVKDLSRGWNGVSNDWSCLGGIWQGALVAVVILGTSLAIHWGLWKLWLSATMSIPK